MNSIDTETVADIVAEIRAYGAQPPPRCMWLDIADRVETAARRERDHAVEHATRHAEAVARDNCRDCVHNPSGKNYEGGNAAAMREALEKARGVIKAMGGYWARETLPIIDAALAAPPRNCDVGTAEEQTKRMDAYCASHGERIGRSWRCDNCPLCSIDRCELVWAQMPYTAEEGDE